MPRVHAVFREGAFIPTEPCDLPEGAEVDLVVHTAQPELSQEERRRAVARAVEAMKANPIQGNPPRFTRDELHERS